MRRPAFLRRPVARTTALLLAGLTALASGLYAVRWPLLGGWVRGLVEQKLSQLPGVRISYGHLGGTLVSSLRLREIHVVSPPGSPLEVAELDRVEISYPWFGLGGLRIRAKGVTIRLRPGTPGTASSSPSAPLQERIRNSIESAEQFRLPAAIDLESVAVFPATGEPVRIPEASLRRRSAEGTAVSASTGVVRWSLSFGDDHRIDAEARAESGPVTEVALHLRPEAGRHALEVRCRALDREWRFGGTADFGPDGRLARVRGRFDVDVGEAGLDLDLLTGALRVESSAGLRLEREVRGRLDVTALLEGRLSESIEHWRIARLKAVGAGTYRDLSVALDLSSGGGTLGDLPWQGTLRQGGDSLDATGHAGLSGGWGLAVSLRAVVRDLSVYAPPLPEGMTAGAKDLLFDGRLHHDRQGPWIEGTLAVGPGNVNGLSWEELRLSARLTAAELDLCELSVKGLPGLHHAAIGGQVKLDASPGSKGWPGLLAGDAGSRASIALSSHAPIDLDLPIGTVTDVRAKGLLGSRGIETIELRGSLGEGPFAALGRWDFREPRGAASAHLIGSEMLAFSDRVARLRVSPNLWLARTPAGWKLSGSIDLPTLIYYGDFGGTASPGARASAAAAPKVRLPAAPGGGVLVPLGIETPEPVALDLSISTPRPARLENSLLGTLLQADLHVGGTIAAPSLSGHVESRQGEVKLATGIVLRIDQVRVDLPPEAGGTPSVYFKAHSGKGQAAITAVVAGPLESPSLVLSSDPPRKQEELVAYLAFGHLPGDVGGQEALGMVAGKALAGVTDERPRAEPKDGFWQKLDLGVTSEDAPDPTKRLPWELPPTTSARGTILRTEYILSPLFSVVVESDQEANLSGDLKIRFHFR